MFDYRTNQTAIRLIGFDWVRSIFGSVSFDWLRRALSTFWTTGTWRVNVLPFVCNFRDGFTVWPFFSHKQLYLTDKRQLTIAFFLPYSSSLSIYLMKMLRGKRRKWHFRDPKGQLFKSPPPPPPADVLKGFVTCSCHTNVCWIDSKKRRPITAHFPVSALWTLKNFARG